MLSKDVFVHISEKYYTLTNSEKKIVDVVHSLESSTQFMSISELAEACGVADATISRFCRNLGYANYSTFKLALASSRFRKGAEHVSSSVEGDDVAQLAKMVYENDVDALRQTLNVLCYEELSNAVDVLLQSEKVICMGHGASGIMAQEVAHLFSTSFSGYFAVSDSHMQAIVAASLSPKDAVIYFSYSGSIRTSEEVLKVVRDNGAKVILVTRFPKSPTATFADIILKCGSNETPLQHGSVAARLAQLYLMDILLEVMCRKAPDTSSVHREKVAEALINKHM